MFRSVRDVVCSAEYTTIIAPDHMAGLRHRYSVLRLWRSSGRVEVLGLELPLKEARKLVSK